MQWMKRSVEAIMFGSRWLVAPFLLGLIVGVVALLYKFVFKVVDFLTELGTDTPADVIVGVLNLVDLTLTANLVVIVICSSYENFLAPLDAAKKVDRPEGLIHVAFSGR